MTRELVSGTSDPKLLLKILETSPSCICARSKEGVYLYVNAAFEKTVGKNRSEIIGKTAKEIFPPAFAQTVDEDVARAVSTRAPHLSESSPPQGPTHDGQRVFLKSVFPIFNSSQETKGACCFAADITEHKSQESENAQVMAAIHEVAIIATTDADGKILEVNENFCKISGYSAAELIGEDHRIINSGYHPKSFFKEMWETISSGKTWRGEIRNRAKDGSFYWVETLMAPILDLNGKIKKYIAIRFDITFRKEAQRQLLEAERQATLGQMAGGLANEMTNPLMVVDEKVKNLQKSLLTIGNSSEFEVDSVISDLEKLHLHIRRVIKLNSDLKTFSNASEEEPFGLHDIKSVIQNAVEQFRDVRKGANQVEIRILPVPPVGIECRPKQISRLLTHLLTNAYEAVLKLDPKWIEVEARDLGSYITILVRDSGEGIPKDLAFKIMQPFFTTKKNDRGAGLGLNISKGIVEAHRGQLFLEPGEKNTCFVIELPKSRV